MSSAGTGRGETRGRAIISVYDKTDVVEMGRFLSEIGLELLSSGGTATVLERAGLDVRRISEATGFPELLDGRVKTLHPFIHAGVLARLEREEDAAALQTHGIVPVRWVVVNLYPFEEALSKRQSEAEQLEFIDIGGPTLLRAGAKNFRNVVVVDDPQEYPLVQQEYYNSGEITLATRRRLAAQVFRRMKKYDGAVADYLSAEREI